jgi:predicted transcriptional regulator
MADKKQFSVRLPPDTAKRVEDYAENNEIARADALRRAIEDYFIATDGAVTEDEFDEWVANQRERERRQQHAQTAQRVANLLGLAYLVAYLQGMFTGITTLLLGVVVLSVVIATTAYGWGAGG